MTKLFRRLPLPYKLLLIGVIPLTFIIFLALRLNKDNEEKMETLQNFNMRMNRYADLIQLVDDLQLERRYSFNYIATGRFQTEMVLQRKSTDEHIRKIVNTYEGYESLPAFTFIDSLAPARSAIDQKNASDDAVINYYTNALFRVNTLAVASTAGIPYLEPINNRLLVQKMIAEAATYLGILRINIYRSMIKNDLNAQSVEQLRSLYGIYGSFVREMRLRADHNTRKRLDSAFRDPNIQFIENYLQKMFNGEATPSIAPDDWLSTTALAVDKFKSVQTKFLQEVQKEVADLYHGEENARIRNIIALLVIMIIVVMIIFYTAASINRSLNNLQVAARRISEGRSANDLKVESKDSIGSLIGSMKELDKANHIMASAADSIGKGDFSVVINPRSKEDVLGNALVEMKDDLQAFRRENEKKIWLQTGLSSLSEAIQGEHSPEALTKTALRNLAEYLQAHYAVCYTNEENELLFAADYALMHNQHLPKSLAAGESLIGEAAQKKKIFHLKDLPDHFLKVSTAAGATSPKEVVVFPLVHDNIAEGVIELGSLAGFPAGISSLAEDAGRIIAVALRSAKSRKQLQELLEEVQAQSEELQAQHQEMENVNAELEAQTERLQSSEEELRVQQEELMQANKELEERSKLLEDRNTVIVERNTEIQKKAEELELSTKYKSEFLANMSHELRTPLNSILLLSRLLKENNSKNLNEEQIEYAHVIQSSGHGLLSLIDEILDLSKIESGKMELEYGTATAEDMAMSMQMLFAPLAKEKNIDFKVNIADNAKQTLQTDRMRVEQILKNLISNAIKFTSKGGVTLDVYADKEQEHIIAFKVTDTGIGIPKEKQNLVFEAFQQADGSTKRKFGGTGLGLSISKQLAQLLGGAIQLESEPGKGSSFTLLLPESKQYALKEEINENIAAVTPVPLQPKEETKTESPKLITAKIPEPIPDDRDAIQSNDKTILIVEDDTNFAKALMNYTREKGYKTLVAVSGDVGIELAEKYKPTGILLDIQLPVKDGWQVMESLKKNPATRHIPVHIMSSFEAKKESLAKGAVDFINKPVAFDQMNDVLQKLEFVLQKRSKKVLIVEDNPKHAKALSLFLETNAVKSEIADSLSGGISALKDREMECVILDMGMPDLKAYETLEKVKKEEGLQNVPVIIFTGKTLSRAEEQKIKQYADSIVVKTAQSFKRILDEVSIFLHLMEENKNDTEKTTGTNGNMINNILAGKKVLIADDDVRNIFSLTKALEAHKMNVISAPDGEEAVKLLENNPDTDIVLMDMMMPEMDGYEATTRIRKIKKFSSLPIIAVTAKAMTGDREKCISAGASDYISKPVDIDQLTALLKVWLYDRN